MKRQNLALESFQRFNFFITLTLSQQAQSKFYFVIQSANLDPKLHFPTKAATFSSIRQLFYLKLLLIITTLCTVERNRKEPLRMQTRSIWQFLSKVMKNVQETPTKRKVNEYMLLGQEITATLEAPPHQ